MKRELLEKIEKEMGQVIRSEFADVEDVKLIASPAKMKEGKIKFEVTVGAFTRKTWFEEVSEEEKQAFLNKEEEDGEE